MKRSRRLHVEVIKWKLDLHVCEITGSNPTMGMFLATATVMYVETSALTAHLFCTMPRSNQPSSLLRR